MNKKCSACGDQKPLSEFQKRAASNDGLTASCKACLAIRDAQKHLKNRDSRLSMMREYAKTQSAKAAHAVASLKWRSANQERRAAHYAVSNALRSGELKKLNCFVCGAANVEAHHPDYSSPLDVVWLCVTHHKETHALADWMERKAA